jgi:natural product precursor
MKKIGKIKLNQFSAVELDRRKMNALKGGCICSSGCYCPGMFNSITALTRIPDHNVYFY